MTSEETALDTPLTLPCGATLPNRLAKAAMTEGMADPMGRVGDDLVRLYDRWGRGGTGLIITGNIQIDRRSLERAGNVRIEGPQDPAQMASLSRLAEAGQANGSRMWTQIAHAGRQAPADACPEPVAPSAIPLTMLRWTQRAPRALTEDEIEDLIRRFAAAASVAKSTGFHGAEIHGAHGYLISEFLSPSVNHRTDRWGGPLENRARFLLEVVRETRRAVGADFPIGLKLNSADFHKGGFSHEESLQVVEWMNEEGLDLLEITGGTYENLSMIGVTSDDDAPPMAPRRESTKRREAYFATYAADARRIATMPVMATGGFRTRATMIEALSNGSCDMIGLGRPLCVDPDISRKLLSGKARETMALEHEMALSEAEKADLPPEDIETTTALGQQAFFFLTLFDMGAGRDPDLSRTLPQAQAELSAREAEITAALQ